MQFNLKKIRIKKSREGNSMEPTQNILNIFEQISAIPRGSGNEEQISNWLQERAAAHGFSFQTDEARNLLIRVPATAGYESAPVVILQGHMDMVCEKTPDSPHNFLKDPIRCITDGDWMHADRTTLGADNGIAIALGLALAEDSSVQHPELELLFTAEEETGLNGANLLKPGFIKGKILLNLDSEDVGTFIIGCAGGQGTFMRLPLSFTDSPAGAAFQLKVSGLHGGHSGVDIGKHFASANKLLARILYTFRQISPLQLMNLKGGTAHNAIAREAEASFICAAGKEEELYQAMNNFKKIFSDEYSAAEKGISLSLTRTDAGRAVSVEDSAKIINLISALPHGVAEMSAGVEGFVETSGNFASIEISGDALTIITSQRSTVMTRIAELTARISSIGLLAGAEVNSTPPYSAWQPDMNSPLLRRSIETYRKLFGSVPKVEMIHAGLECGVIGAIYKGLDMISLGVTVENPHSPNERMYIPSVGKAWKFLVEFLKESR
jgi:dipeptidase D